MNLSLQGKTTLIGGSTQGIGFAAAQQLALQGATCVLISRNEESLKTAIAQLSTAQGQKHAYLVADYSFPELVKQKVETFVQSQPVHILINNTGGPPAGYILDAKDEDFLSAFQQHLINNHHLTQLVVPGMRENKYGRIINVVSTSVRTPLAGLGVSNTIRGAVASWAKTMANELGKDQITVNNVLPGFTQTQRLEQLLKNNAVKNNITLDEAKAQMTATIPMQRIGSAKEVANVIGFLASPAASYVSGISIAVDGGKTPAS